MEINNTPVHHRHQHMSTTTVVVISMADGVDATYNKGGFLVYHKGIAYLNLDSKTHKPIIFAENTVGKLNEHSGEIEIEGQLFGRMHTLPKAKTIQVKMMEDGSTTTTTASYLEGGYELTYNGDTYLLVDETPFFEKNSGKNLTGILSSISSSGGETTTTRRLQIPFIIGIRGRGFHTFEKQSEKSTKKRRKIDTKSEKMFEVAEKRAKVIRKNAPDALKLAKKALKAVKELVAFEEAARLENGSKKEPMFENPYFDLQNAVSAVSAVVLSANGGEIQEEEDDDDGISSSDGDGGDGGDDE